MTWNCRIIHESKRNPIKGGRPRILHYYGLREVYYRKNGKPYLWMKESLKLGGYESPKDLTEALAMMLSDAVLRPTMRIKRQGKKEVLVEESVR